MKKNTIIFLIIWFDIKLKNLALLTWKIFQKLPFLVVFREKISNSIIKTVGRVKRRRFFGDCYI